MPPKKAKAAAAGDEANDGGKSGWTAEADRKLLILGMGRTLTPADYHEIVKVMPGRNFNGVRQRFGKFRTEQRKLYEEYGWTVPDGTAPNATPRKAAAAPDTTKTRKRGQKDSEAEDGPADDQEDIGAVKRAKLDDGEDMGVKEEPQEDTYE
ncbi:hypothetical protein BDV96DRAFT_646897 [Lophiotrema nucula]|uniref:Myb-like domain-containing protein n=1 Tax=Lophiotrema nucula TaxID=690887 RepID=A0A6A5Z6Y2_9PLEO|nr:hypothetical protein BDV96DRAFT_646897 [Lophiotrema nucula]